MGFIFSMSYALGGDFHTVALRTLITSDYFSLCNFFYYIVCVRVHVVGVVQEDQQENQVQRWEQFLP